MKPEGESGRSRPTRRALVTTLGSGLIGTSAAICRIFLSPVHVFSRRLQRLILSELSRGLAVDTTKCS
jgi:hypothetical protein